MATSYTSRIGSAPEEGIKQPCVVSTQANITLSGEQTINSLAVVAGDRVLVRNQTDNTENGIYDVSTGSWARSTDFNAANDLINGNLVPDAQSGFLYQVSFSGSFSPGTTAITFSLTTTGAEDTVVTNKAAAVLLTPVANTTLFVNGTDGGLFKGVTGAAAATYSDNGGSYCGTQFIPTGGDGSAAWVRVDGGYNVGLGIQLSWFGAVGDGVADDTSASQAALDLAKSAGYKIKAETGEFLITTSLTFDTSGDGNVPGLIMEGDGYANTIFKNGIVAGGSTIILTSGTSYGNNQLGGRIEGIGFTESGSGANSHGIQYQGTSYQEFNSLKFESLNGSGIKGISTLGDADSSSYVTIFNSNFLQNAGPGYDGDNGNAGLAVHTIQQCNFDRNATANILLEGCAQFDIINCSVTGQGVSALNVPGIWLKSGALANRLIRIVGGEHGNNQGTNILVDSVANLYVGHLRMVRRVGETNNTKGIDITDGTAASVSGVTIEEINLAIDDATPTWTFLTIGTRINSVAVGLTVKAPTATAFFAGNIYTAFNAGAEDKPVDIEALVGTTSGTALAMPLNRSRVTEATAGTITPDLLNNGAWLQYNLTDSGAYTIAKPSNGNYDGALWELTIINGSGAARVSFGTGITTNGYIDSANPNTAKFRYDKTSTTWRQVGSWSNSKRSIVTDVGNITTGEDDLMSHILPGNSLGTNGDSVRVIAWGRTINNANAKTVKVYWGATAILTCSLTTSQASVWRVEMDIVRTGATTSEVIVQAIEGGAATQVFAGYADAASGTHSGDITIKLTGEATATSDIIQEGMIIKP